MVTATVSGAEKRNLLGLPFVFCRKTGRGLPHRHTQTTLEKQLAKLRWKHYTPTTQNLVVRQCSAQSSLLGLPGVFYRMLGEASRRQTQTTLENRLRCFNGSAVR